MQITKKELEKIIKPLKIKKNCKYVIFISKDSGLYKEDLYRINKSSLGMHSDSLFVLIDGDVSRLVKAVEVK